MPSQSNEARTICLFCGVASALHPTATCTGWRSLGRRPPCEQCEDGLPRWVERAFIVLLLLPGAFHPEPIYRWSGIISSAIWFALTISSFRAWRRTKRRRPPDPAPLEGKE